MSHLKIVSWNVRGINSPAKRSKILNHLKKLKADICLLQETHLLESEHKKLKKHTINTNILCILQLKEKWHSYINQ